MKASLFAFALAAAGTALSASPAIAAAPSERVRFDDLQLTAPEGQAELQRRLDRATWKVCLFDARGSLRSADQTVSCYREVRKDVAVRTAEIIADRQFGG